MEKMSFTTRNTIWIEKGKKILIKLKGDGTSMSNTMGITKKPTFY